MKNLFKSFYYKIVNPFNFKKLDILVQNEIINLKKHATKSELSRLNINTFNGHSGDNCIYGQMTHYCFNNRASELIKACCDKIYIPGRYTPDNHLGLNGSPKDLPRNKFWSPIEVEVAKLNKKVNINIINQLKY